MVKDFQSINSNFGIPEKILKKSWKADLDDADDDGGDDADEENDGCIYCI